METSAPQQRNHGTVKMIAWVVISISVLTLLRILILSQGYGGKITMHLASGKFIPSTGINYTFYFLQHMIMLQLSILLFVSATFLLKYKERWRKVIVSSLIASVIFLLVYPLVNYYWPPVPVELFGARDAEIVKSNLRSTLIWSYLISIILSVFFILSILKLSEKEVKSLFK